MNSGLYFSDVFNLAPEILDAYGAFNISLINDLPVFVDPFLLFYSDDEAHRAQHDAILTYLRFLRQHAVGHAATQGTLQAWYMFSEVKQNWLGYSRVGNRGAGLGPKFARALHANLNEVFRDFGSESITKSSHLEKLCLVQEGVGRDSISDFVTNLIKDYLLRYTETFARTHLPPDRCRAFRVNRTKFDYGLGVWVPERFLLPVHNDDYVILTPTSLLTRDDTWISNHDLHSQFDSVVASVPNTQLREELNEYVRSQIPKEPAPEDWVLARSAAIRKFPELLDYYIRLKEDTGDQARRSSSDQVQEVEQLFIEQVSLLVEKLARTTDFYRTVPRTIDEARARVLALKHFIENLGGGRFFYAGRKPIRREQDLHLLYRLIWFATPTDQPTGSTGGGVPAGKPLVEFKLASNPSLRRSLESQAHLYREATGSPRPIRVIVHFNEFEQIKMLQILEDLRLRNCSDIVLIDASIDNESPESISGVTSISRLVDLPKPPWGNIEMVKLCELLVGAYGDLRAARHLALSAGVNLDRWNEQQAPQPAWRDLLDVTMSQRRLTRLLEVILMDEHVRAYHERIQAYLDLQLEVH